MRHQIHDFLGGLAGLTHGDSARKLGDLGHIRPMSQIVVHFGRNPDAPRLAASPMVITGLSLRARDQGISEKGCQVGMEAGLIRFNGEPCLASEGMDAKKEILLSMESIGGADAPNQRKAGKKRLCYGDLVGLFRNSHLQKRFLTVVGPERK